MAGPGLPVAQSIDGSRAMSAITANIASHLPAMAASHPDKDALVEVAGRSSDGTARYRALSFAELNAASDYFACWLEERGITRGVRCALLVRPSLQFFALVFALFKVGAVPVMVDPAIGLKKLRRCLAEVEPGAFIGVPEAHIARLLMGSALRSVEVLVTVGRRWLWGGHRLPEARLDGEQPYSMAATDADELAAILFTSGSTGVPKGAVYSHGMFSAQVAMLRSMYGFAPDEIDLPTFPLFALFDPALGMTAVLPEMDFSKPGKADPALLLEAIRDRGCTNMFGSPALLARLGEHLQATGQSLPSLRRVLSAGAPVPHSVLTDVVSGLSDGAQVFTPYGATESLPVCNIGSDEVLGETAAATEQGRGICVGRPVDGVAVRIIQISDKAIENWSDQLLVAAGEIGEITVQGPVVSASYWARPEQTALAKICDEQGSVIHRMGDLGYLDDQGRLWMCGRKSHRVQTVKGDLCTIPIERFFDSHAALGRTALVGSGAAGSQQPVLLVEEESLAAGSDVSVVIEELKAMAASQPLTAGIDEIQLYPGSFPVDIRHNAKIRREDLRVWLSGRLG